ncbi:hypothetical protein CCUS01_14191 [Colletotrichum cuscutae]|uniref:Uncharacterized protein n=1 Tax=Colletotrichum cuscutae TaxID=1209917 RepID=A0AAJ0DLU3_9PEZI|nr:hypothetical protein CCUS01_14191 [Colletotrichum cuscutae]
MDPGFGPRMKLTKPGGRRKGPLDPQPHYGAREGHPGSTEMHKIQRGPKGTNQELEPWRWFVREILDPCA